MELNFSIFFINVLFVILSILFLLEVQLGFVEFFITVINSFHTSGLLPVSVLSRKWSALSEIILG